MNYSSISTSVNNSGNFLNTSVINISEIKFSSNWSGAASENLLLNLKDSLDKINILSSNLKIYSIVLNKVQEIVVIDKEIDELTSQLSELDEKKDAALIASIKAKINELKEKREKLKNLANSLLVSIKSVDSSTDSAVVDSLYAKMTLDEKKFAEENKNQQSENKEEGQDGSESDKSSSEEVNNEDDKPAPLNPNYKGEVLNAKMGILWNGPSGSETFCPDQPVGAIKIMMDVHGYSDVELYYRDDGVTLVRGVDPNGQKFEDLVAVAADLYDEPSGNLDGIYKRGDIVQTSLGTGMVIDMCGRAQNVRAATGGIHYDIYTAWHDENERWYHEIYGK